MNAPGRAEPESRRSVIRLAVGLVVLLAAFLTPLGVGSAAAHAELLETDPADGAVLEEAPGHVTLRFNEQVRVPDGGVRLFATGGADPRELEASVVNNQVVAQVPADLPDGGYVLGYRVVSADGHPVSGALTFSVGMTTVSVSDVDVLSGTPASTRAAMSVLTALRYLGLLVLVGLLLFERLVRRSPGVSVAVRARARFAAGLAVVASVLLVPVAALNVAGEGLSGLVDPERWWSTVLWQPVTAAVIVACSAPAALMLSARRGPWRWIGLAMGAAALAALLLLGHSQLVQPQALMLGADWGHLITAAFWTGGVLALVLDRAEMRRTAADAAQAVQLVLAFSRWAVWSVALLVLSGLAMALLILDEPSALLTSAYGSTLLLKVFLVLPVLAIAAWNRRRLLPTVLRAPDHASGWRALDRTLGYEAALLVAVVVVTGFLTNLSPNHAHRDHGSTVGTAEALELHASAQGLEVSGTLGSARAGASVLDVMVTFDGEPVDAESVTLRASLPEQGLGPIDVSVEPAAARGELRAALDLPLSGRWELQVLARVSTFSEPIVIIPVEIG